LSEQNDEVAKRTDVWSVKLVNQIVRFIRARHQDLKC
jgi:hypothetical protein